MMRWKIIGHPRMQIFYATQGSYSTAQKLFNKQSAKVVCRVDRLRIAHSKRLINHVSIG